MKMIMTLSVVIHTKNAGKTLKKALNSVKFADEIVIVDMHSSDDTVEIARRFTRKIFSYKDMGYADPARNFGLDKATGPWVLVLDADEEVPVELRNWIQSVVSPKSPEPGITDAYYLPRQNHIFERWIEHTAWWPDYQLRFFRKGSVSWLEGVHRLPAVTGSYTYLPAEKKYSLLHHNYLTVHEYIERMNRYTELTAAEKVSPAEITSQQAFSVFSQELCRRLFAEKGIADGLHGASLSLLQANYELVVLLKQWQKTGFKAKQSSQDVIKGITQLTSDLHYWTADWSVQHTTGLAQIWWKIRRKLKF